MAGDIDTPPDQGGYTVRLVAAEGLDPFDQGEFDGLCGLYASINALRLLLAASSTPLSYDQAERLFRTGIEYLDAHDRLSNGAHWGMSLSFWRDLTERLCRKAAKMTEVRIQIERPFAPRKRVPPWAVYAAIGFAIERQRPVLVLLRGAYDHFTVVAGLCDSRLTLFDSYGFDWIARKSCSIGGRPPKRHQLAPASVTILSIQSDGDEPA